MQWVGGLLGSVATVYFVVMVCSALLDANRRRQKHRLTCQLLALQVESAAIKKRQHEQIEKCWNGYRKFVVNKKEFVADGVCSFELKPHDGRPLPLFSPGQFLTFSLDIPGQPKSVVRCYSISSAPYSHAFEVTVKHVADGLVSSYFHEQVEPGDILDVQAPRGQFCIDPAQQKPLVLIAGGVGITPFLSMLRTIDQTETGREIVLFYAVQNESQHILKNELNNIASKNGGMSFYTGYSNPTSSCSVGDCQFSGYLTIDFIKSALPSSNYEFYICGPPPMMDKMQSGLKAWGVPDQAIHIEAFGESSVSSAKNSESTKLNQKDEASRGHGASVVNLVKSSKEINWTTESEDLLALIESAGVEIDSGCRSGNCGSCEVAIRSGTIRYLKPLGYSCPEGTCLPCIAVPDGNLELDV